MVYYFGFTSNSQLSAKKWVKGVDETILTLNWNCGSWMITWGFIMLFSLFLYICLRFPINVFQKQVMIYTILSPNLIMNDAYSFYI